MDTVARLPGPDAVTWVDYLDGRPASTRQLELPLGQVGLAAPVADGVAVVRPGARDLSYLDLQGEVVGRAGRTDLERVAVTRALKERFVELAVAERPNGGPPPGVIRRDVEVRLGLLVNDHELPPFDRILASADGRQVWLRHYVLPFEGDGTTAWTVYGLDRTLQAEVRLPVNLRPTHILSDGIAGIEVDPSGVEYVVVYGVVEG